MNELGYFVDGRFDSFHRHFRWDDVFSFFCVFPSTRYSDRKVRLAGYTKRAEETHWGKCLEKLKQNPRAEVKFQIVV